jgi:hypothetical protein
MKKYPQWSPLHKAGLALLGLLAAEAKADSWALPQDSTYESANGRFQFFVALRGSQGVKGPSGTLRRKSGDQWEPVWTNQLVDRVIPVQVRVPDSGRYVVTFDEYHSVGQHPVVIYGESGRLIAHLTLADLRLENHPYISRSVSSYHWNESAMFLFGPAAKAGAGSPERMLEDSLFIRLYWGEVIPIDLATGKVRDAAWGKTLTPQQAAALKKGADDFLEATWLRLAREYFRKENFTPNPKDVGIKGLLLVRQLRLREALPLLREIAATEQFRNWAAPRWGNWQGGNVQELARAVLAELE